MVQDGYLWNMREVRKRSSRWNKSSWSGQRIWTAWVPACLRSQTGGLRRKSRSGWNSSLERQPSKFVAFRLGSSIKCGPISSIKNPRQPSFSHCTLVNCVSSIKYMSRLTVVWTKRIPGCLKICVRRLPTDFFAHVPINAFLFNETKCSAKICPRLTRWSADVPWIVPSINSLIN